MQPLSTKAVKSAKHANRNQAIDADGRHEARCKLRRMNGLILGLPTSAHIGPSGIILLQRARNGA
jgi:hypothetical protein